MDQEEKRGARESLGLKVRS